MKIITRLILMAILIVYLEGCAEDDESVVGTGLDDVILASTTTRNLSPTVSQTVINDMVIGNTKFALALFSEWADDVNNAEKNLCFSPFSISTAFSMLYAGAVGNTAAELREVFHFSQDDTALFSAFNVLSLSLNTPVEIEGAIPFTLSVKNSLWIQTDFLVKTSFLDTISGHYDAVIGQLDMTSGLASEESRQFINQWVADNTNDKIVDLLPEESIDNAKLVLTNTVYFFANWLNKFDPQNTVSGSFYLENGSSINVDFMQQSSLPGKHIITDSYEAIELLYAGSRMAMEIIIPNPGSMSDVLSGFKTDGYDPLNGASGKHITLKLPKFTIESELKLKELLQALGLNDVFDLSAADLTGIANVSPSLFVFDGYHKSVIAIDENGTEAAAATAIVVGNVGGIFVDVTIDRSFLFFIRDRTTKTILFAGRVMKPTVI